MVLTRHREGACVPGCMTADEGSLTQLELNNGGKIVFSVQTII